MADKDVEITEAAQVPTGRADAAQDAQPEVGQSDVGQSDVGQSDVGQSDVGQSDVGQSDVGQSDVGQSDVGQSDVGQSEIEQSGGGQSEDSTAPGAGPAALGDGAAPEDSRRAGKAVPDGRRPWRAVAALGAATVILGGFGVWATLHANSERNSAAAQNTALTDGPATAAVKREISAAVNTIFSYNYANTAATRRAAQSLLTGPAVRQYNTLFALVAKNAPAQKLVVTTRVTNAGVELLNGNRARLLVFANQQDTKAGTSQT